MQGEMTTELYYLIVTKLFSIHQWKLQPEHRFNYESSILYI